MPLPPAAIDIDLEGKELITDERGVRIAKEEAD